MVYQRAYTALLILLSLDVAWQRLYHIEYKGWQRAMFVNNNDVLISRADDLYAARPAELDQVLYDPVSTNQIDVPKTDPIVANPCANPEDCNDIGSRIYRINNNYPPFHDKEFMKNVEGFDIINEPRQLHHRQRRNAINFKDWPKDEKTGLINIPYTITDPAIATRINSNLEKAKKEFEKYTCFRLVPRKPTDVNYVSIVDRSGCWSYVGRVGGAQQMSLSDDCEHMNVIMHEFLHVIGFFHEQARRDRDLHIKVNWTNIESYNWVQFRVRPYGSVFVHGKPYDINSIMQYGRKAGAKDGRYDAMTSVQFPKQRLGVPDGSTFSLGDRLQLNLKSVCNTNVKVYGGPYAHKVPGTL